MTYKTFKAKVAVKGRVVIPKEFRKALGIHAGDIVHVELQRDEIVIRKEPENAVATMQGLLKGAWPTEVSSVEVQREMRREWKKREKRLET
ncbi:MAG: AbrB/MazE/SpoVT family DNA-binding domain-containing protein [Candidatus Geothermarchaeales archaeon]